ncbi:MAG: hypothetical protein N2511_00260 [Thermodesulfovibrionales bacterium]|nr:hypothetical protein [Thermodesulfovibrionales bacterium]
MKDRFVIVNHKVKTYQKASKKLKSKMLEELSKILYRNKQYIASLLRKSSRVIKKR